MRADENAVSRWSIAPSTRLVAPFSAGPSDVTPVGVPGLPTKRPSACAYLSMPSLRRVRNAVPGVTSLSPSFSPRRNGPRPLNSLPRPVVPIKDAMIGNAAQHGVADIGAAAILDVAADRIAAARIADQSHARRAGAAFQFLDGLAEFAALVFGRGFVRLGLGIVGARQGIGEIDREHAVARNPVRFHPPQRGHPQRRVVAIAMHEQDRRNSVAPGAAGAVCAKAAKSEVAGQPRAGRRRLSECVRRDILIL